VHDQVQIAGLRRNTRNSLFFATILAAGSVVVSALSESHPARETAVAWLIGAVMAALLAVCAVVYAINRRRFVAHVSICLQIVGSIWAMAFMESEIGGSLLFANAVFDIVRLGKWRDEPAA